MIATIGLHEKCHWLKGTARPKRFGHLAELSKEEEEKASKIEFFETEICSKATQSEPPKPPLPSGIVIPEFEMPTSDDKDAFMEVLSI